MEAIVTDHIIETRQTTSADVVHAYYQLTKPGITQMVVFTASAGYYLSVREVSYFTSVYNVLHFLVAMLGTALISSGACTLNMYLERSDDNKMKRTKNRPIPSGIISPNHALYFGILLSVIGSFLLAYINVYTLVLALFTHLSYVVLYTPLKKKSWTAMLLGGIPGALPAMGGWTAGANSIDIGAWILFLIMFVWQMPHFLALAIMYRKDYEQGGFVLLGNSDTGSFISAKHLFAYVLVLIPIGLSLTLFNVTGYLYLFGSLVLSSVLLITSISLLRSTTVTNARKALLASYAYLMGLFIFMFVDKL